MSEIAVLSLMVSSLGIDAVLLANWLCSIQINVELEQEEEETLTRYDSEDIKKCVQNPYNLMAILILNPLNI